MLPPEKREVFIKLWLSGVKEAEIARILGIHVNDVPFYAKVLGLPRRSRGAPPNRKIRDEDVELIKEMWMNGATVKEIADYFGVHESTIQSYLRAMGLRRREKRKCPDIPREELEKLCLEGRSDVEIASMYNTSRNCIMKLRLLYGINKRMLAERRRRRKMDENIEKIISILNEKGYTTSMELLEKYGIRIDKEILDSLKSLINELEWFRLVYTSTARYSIFPPKFNNMTIVYLRGREKEVVYFLLSNLIDRNVPTTALKIFLKMNGAPEELVKTL